MSINNGYINVYSLDNLNKVQGFLIDKKINGLNKIEENSFSKVMDLIDKWEINISGFVIGNEFCEHMYIPLEELKKIINSINEEFDIIIQTSILTIYNESYYNELFFLLKDKEIKIIINDLGFFDLIKNIEGFSPKIILGRLLTKTRKVFDIKEKDKYLYNSFETKEYHEFMAKLGVNGLGLDILPQGNNIIDFSDKYIYFPWGYYTSSRGCFTNSSFTDKSHVYPVTNCNKICKNNYFTIGKTEFIGRGNVIFYNSAKYITPEIIDNTQIFILQPFLPK